VTQPGAEIAVGNPEEPPDDSPPVVSKRAVETVTLALILAFALLMMYDNWRTGIRWESTGPQAGYFPFYVSLIMAGACVFGLVNEVRKWGAKGEPFVRRNQFKRVLQVFVPTLAFVPVTQWLGLYVASFILVSGFMYFIGRIKPWKSVLTGYVFSALMFAIFEVAFNVIMPKGPLERLFGF
jgi:hypothetical protein